MKEIIVYTDFVCPFCLLVDTLLRDVIEGQDIKITWKPHELRPFPVLTLKVEDGYLPLIWKQTVYPMAEKLGVDIKLPTISPQPRTDKAFQAFAFAEQYGKGDVFSVATLSAFFQHDLDIGQTDVLLQIADEVGLDSKLLKKSLAREEFSQIHKVALNHAKQVDKIKVVPTIIIGSERFEGVPNKEWLECAIKKSFQTSIVETA